MKRSRGAWAWWTVGAMLLVAAGGCEQDPSFHFSDLTPCHLDEGDLLITEFFTDPPGADDGKEWVEIYNATDEAIDLRGVLLIRETSDRRHTVGGVEPVLLEPGAYGVLTNGDLGPEPFYDYGESLGNLPNGGERFQLACVDGTLVDEACYGSGCDPELERPDEGLSFAFTGEVPDAEATGDLSNWAVGPPTPGAGVGSCPVSPGEIVLTEILTNPEGSDEGKEWFEIYNASDEALDLVGLRIVLSPDDGPTFHTIEDDHPVLAEPGAYMVIASGEVELGEGYVYGPGLGTFTNSGDVLALACPAGAEISRACWGSGCGPLTPVPGEEQAFALTAPGPPTVENGADPTWWTVQEPTPGEENPEAPQRTKVEPPEDCDEPDVPTADNISITEVMANPEGPDAGREWLELRVHGERCVDVDGLVISREAETPDGGWGLSEDTGLTVLAPGYHVVAGDSADLGEAPVVQRVRLTLRNTDGLVTLWYEGNKLDTVEYGDADDGVAYQRVDGGWCPSTQPAPDGSFFGSPGQANPPCDACLCFDDDGELVEVTPPAPGELVVTEALPDVPGLESEGILLEWFEARLSDDLDGPRSMACLEYGNDYDVTKTTPFVNPERSCLEFEPGETILFGRSADPEENGGIAPDVIYDGGALKGSGGLVLRRSDGTLVDGVVSYGSTDDGVAVQVAPGATDLDNDEAEAWCPSPKPTPSAAHFGSPGEPNPPCGACFCVDDGGEVVETTPPAAGELVVTEVLPDVPGPESEGVLFEWFEARLADDLDGPRSMTCLEFGNDYDVTSTTPMVNPEQACLEFPPGATILFGRSADPEENGGIAPDVIYDGGELKGSGGLVLRRSDGTLVDGVVSYGKASDGVARQVDPTTTDLDNDEAEAWCDALPVYNTELGARGTPGESNLTCEGCWCREGDQWVEGTAPGPEELVISEVFSDPSPSGGEEVWEWFEVYSAANVPRELTCLQPRFGGEGPEDDLEPLSVRNPDCVTLQPQSYAVLCNDPATAADDLGISECLGYEPTGLRLSDRITLLAEGEVVASFAWEGNTSDGASIQVHDVPETGACAFTPEAGYCDAPGDEVYASFEDPSDPESTLTFVGTPGAANPCCPAP